MNHLRALAAARNITVTEGRMEKHTGLYVPVVRTILISTRFDYAIQRVALAHQLGHAALGHPLILDQPKTPEQERRADEWAATQLLTPEAFLSAQESHHDDLDAMAEQLAVTPGIIRIWKDGIGRCA